MADTEYLLASTRAVQVFDSETLSAIVLQTLVERRARCGLRRKDRPWAQGAAVPSYPLADRLVGRIWMTVRLGLSCACVEEPTVQLLKALDSQAGSKEPLAHQPDVVLDTLARRSPRPGCRAVQ